MKRALRIAGLVLLLLASASARAQGQITGPPENGAGQAANSSDQSKGSQAPTRALPPVTSVSVAPPAFTLRVHRFWDTENLGLFAGVAEARGLDYASTLNMRRRGVNEALLTNAIVDNHPEFAGIEAAGSMASIGVSYLFHRAGHHRLERLVSIVHIGVGMGGAGRNYALKTVHNP